ncbi:MAG: hypothetical protein IJ634_04810 [Bacteroidales bacterium]|nr:hypothetical protein [Bacteroidales bacterium]
MIFVIVSIIFNFQLSIFNSAQAQQSWNYTTITEAHLDDAYLIEPPHALKKLIEKKIAPRKLKYNRMYRLSVSGKRTGKYTLHFQTDSIDVSLPERLATELFPYLVSDRYWRARYRTLQEWAYIGMDNGSLLDVDTSDHRYGPFAPLVWLGYRYQPSPEWPVVFTVRTNTHARQTLTLPALQRLAEWGSFTTDEGLLAYEERQALRQQQELEHRQQLQRQLDSLDNVSELFARQADSITIVLQRDSIDQAEQRLMAEVQATKDRMNRDQIFIMSINPAHSDYMFGLEFNFYNCFQKIVTKVEITVTPINERNQIQKDQFNRDIRTVRCMGPIRPGSPAQYTFDELFWDDRGRIKYMRVTSITFHFTDGTTRSFRGYDNIRKHTLNP